MQVDRMMIVEFPVTKLTKEEYIAAIAAVYSSLLKMGPSRAFGACGLQRFFSQSPFKVSHRDCCRAIELVKVEMGQEPKHTTTPVKGWHSTLSPLPLPGVYAFYDRAQLVYIGSAVNIYSRISGHERRQPHYTVKVRYHAHNSFAWLTQEARLIHRLNPTLNVHHRRFELKR